MQNLTIGEADHDEYEKDRCRDDRTRPQGDVATTSSHLASPELRGRSRLEANSAPRSH